jgi:hypothetical protein
MMDIVKRMWSNMGFQMEPVWISDPGDEQEVIATLKLALRHRGDVVTLKLRYGDDVRICETAEEVASSLFESGLSKWVSGVQANPMIDVTTYSEQWVVMLILRDSAEANGQTNIGPDLVEFLASRMSNGGLE